LETLQGLLVLAEPFVEFDGDGLRSLRGLMSAIVSRKTVTSPSVCPIASSAWRAFVVFRKPIPDPLSSNM